MVSRSQQQKVNNDEQPDSAFPATQPKVEYPAITFDTSKARKDLKMEHYHSLTTAIEAQVKSFVETGLL